MWHIKQDTVTSTEKQFTTCLAGNQNIFSLSELVYCSLCKAESYFKQQSQDFHWKLLQAAEPRLREGACGCRGGKGFLAFFFVGLVLTFQNAQSEVSVVQMPPVQKFPHTLVQLQSERVRKIASSIASSKIWEIFGVFEMAMSLFLSW